MQEGYYSVKGFRDEMCKKGIDMSEKAIRHYIDKGTLKAKKDALRPSRWLIPSSELNRVVANYSRI